MVLLHYCCIICIGMSYYVWDIDILYRIMLYYMMLYYPYRNVILHPYV